MSVSVDISKALAKLNRITSDTISSGKLTLIAGRGVARTVRRHLNHIAKTRHGSADFIGATPSKFWAGGQHGNPREYVNEPINEGQAAVVTITHPGISRAERDVTITPKRSKYLTIPLIADAYGIRAGEFSERNPQFRLFKPRNCNTLAYQKDGKLVHVYALKKSILLQQDASLLPTEKQIAQSAAHHIRQHLDEVLS